MAKIIDNFILIETLGTGHFSETLKGRNLVTKSPVAVKTIKLDQFLTNQPLREMVINEIQLLKRLEHQNILQMLKMLKSSNNIYLIYEFVSGGKISSQISKNGAYSEAKVLGIFRQMLEALSVVHKEDLIHNNLSTETFFLNEEQIKLKNFLMARPSSHKKNVEPELWRYAAPEVLQGRASGFKSDVWSLGVVWYEMLKGVPLIDGANEKEKVLERVMDMGEIEFGGEFSEEMKEIIGRMLRIEESERFSLEDVIREISSLLSRGQKREENTSNTKTNVTMEKNNSNSNKKLEKMVMKERHKVLFIVQNINKILGLNQWVLDYPRNILVLSLLKTGLLGLETLISLFTQEPTDTTANFMLNPSIFDPTEFKSWLSSDFSVYFLRNLKQEAENLKEVISRFSSEEPVKQELENLGVWGLDFFRTETDRIELNDEKAVMRTLFVFASKVYEIISRQKENNSEVVWEEEVKKEQGVLANYLLDVVFFKEFFENFIRNEGRLGEQKYFKHIEGVQIEKLQGMLEKKLAYAKKQLNL